MQRPMELFTKSADLGCSVAHYDLADIYYGGGNMKKAKFHHEAAAMAGHEEGQIQPWLYGGRKHDGGEL